jgi:predicted nucleic-acid-binding Zn-ribbon protein
MIKSCSKCGNHPHSQDELHGKGKRVFNEHSIREGSVTKIVRRCTRCTHEEIERKEHK